MAKKRDFYNPPKAAAVKVTGAEDFPSVGDSVIVGTDMGNGDGQMYAVLNGKLHRVSIPHGRVAVSGMELSKDVKLEGIDYVYSDFPASVLSSDASMEEFNRWGFGEGIEEATGKPIDSNRNSINRYGSPHHIWSVLNGLSVLGLKGDKPITLIVPAPPSYVNDISKDIRRAFLSGWQGKRDGKWVIRPKGAKKWTEYQIANVYVVAEGQPAYAAYRFFLDGRPAPLPDPRYKGDRDALAGMVFVNDIGNGTLDNYRVIAGKVVLDDLKGATDPNGGIQERMLRPILEEVRNATGATHLTESSVDAWLRQWAMSGWQDDAAVVNVSGKTLRLHMLFQRVLKDYAEWIANNRLNDNFRRGADAIMCVGGGWMYVYGLLSEFYHERLFIAPNIAPHLNGINFYDLNAYGTIVQYAAEQRANRK